MATKKKDVSTKEKQKFNFFEQPDAHELLLERAKKQPLELNTQLEAFFRQEVELKILELPNAAEILFEYTNHRTLFADTWCRIFRYPYAKNFILEFYKRRGYLEIHALDRAGRLGWI